ncbi:dienelactone hydrolase family protein [Rhodovibrio salinarum]|uniref:Dienelactone hydrolase family protein n=1 Tax=Rhodovibrio salinarum TaxID=1087 RepID=A0A934V263_9PROT|nr:dienelactone hydrolase family protein [Rhodovibrio salinarum]MBK1699085.1 dienelactone hydrolase family protein [Rhodovibrio salinarum]
MPFAHKVAIAAVPALTLLATPAAAEIVGETVTYEVDGETYEGYYARNTALGDEQPTVLIVHDWDGLGDYERRRAQMLAEQGYAAFAADLYGQGVRPDTLDGKKRESGALYQDREAMRARLQGALDQIDALEGASDDDVVAIGYCFGGSAVLELARSGAELDGFVSFHGGLGTPEGQDYADVQGPLLILHGTQDSVSGLDAVADLAGRLDDAGADYRVELYGGARHAFTVWASQERYHPQADLRSWAALQDFLARELK